MIPLLVASASNMTGLQDEVVQAYAAFVPFLILFSVVGFGVSVILQNGGLRDLLWLGQEGAAWKGLHGLGCAWDAIPREWHRPVEIAAALALALLLFGALLLTSAI